MRLNKFIPENYFLLLINSPVSKLYHVRHAASPKQIATHPESSMATSTNQLNLVKQVQTPMHSFMLLNIARLFTKFKLLHDLCSCSTLFLCLCETFLFDGMNNCEIQISL